MRSVPLAVLRWCIFGYFLVLGLLPSVAYASDCPPDDPSRSDCRNAASTARSPLVPIAGAAAGGAAGWVASQVLGGATNVAPTIPPTEETAAEPDEEARKDPCAADLGALNKALADLALWGRARQEFQTLLDLLEMQYENTRKASAINATIDAGFLAWSIWSKPLASALGRQIVSQTLRQKMATELLKAMGKEASKTLVKTMYDQGISWEKFAEKGGEALWKAYVKDAWKKDLTDVYMQRWATEGISRQDALGEQLAKRFGDNVAGPLVDGYGNLMSLWSMGEGAYSGAQKLTAIRKQISEVRRKLFEAIEKHDEALDAVESGRRILEHCRKIWAR